MFASITLDAIQLHIQSNPLTSEFLRLKQNFEELGENLLLIKDIYWESGQNFVVTNNLDLGVEREQLKKLEKKANDSSGENEKPVYIRQVQYEFYENNERPTLSTQSFCIKSMSSIESDPRRNSAYQFKSKATKAVSVSAQVSNPHKNVKKTQYTTTLIENEALNDILSKPSFSEFLNKTTSVIENDIAFNDLLTSVQIKPSDIFISNKEKLLDLTSFSLTDENHDNKMIATCVKFIPEHHDKLLCSFTFVNSNAKEQQADQMILCKWHSKDIISPEQRVVGNVGITAFIIIDQLIVAGFEDGSLKCYDLQKLTEKVILVDKLSSKSPIVYLKYFEGYLSAVAMDCSISNWLLEDTKLTIIHQTIPKFQAVCLHAEVCQNQVIRLTDDIGSVYDATINESTTVYQESQMKSTFPISFTTEHPFFPTLVLNGSHNLLTLNLASKEVHRISQDCSYICGKWSPTRANVMYALNSEGCLHVYDLLQNDEHPIEIKAVTSTRLIGMDVQVFNFKQYVAMASQDGASYNLKLPRELSKSYPSDGVDFELYLQRLQKSKGNEHSSIQDVSKPILKYTVDSFFSK